MKLNQPFTITETIDPHKFDKADDKMPTTGAKNDIRLAQLRGKAYDDKLWDRLLDQLSIDEMNNLIANGGHSNAAIDSIGKIRLADVDGSATLKDNFHRCFFLYWSASKYCVSQ